MPSEYRIDKSRLPVVVVTTAGDRLRGEIFAQAYARHRGGREEPADVLNTADRFFPLAVRGGDTIMLAKAQDREVETVGESAPDEGAVAARSASIEVVLSGGPTRTGRVFLQVPFDRPRLLDFLNRYEEPFLPLHTDDGLRLVNVALIARVRQLD
jgi:hypothetical protein